MPSSYSFHLPDPPTPPESSRYRSSVTELTNGRRIDKTSTANSKSSSAGKNDGSENGNSKIRDNQHKRSNSQSSNCSADAKWKANYVPTSLLPANSQSSNCSADAQLKANYVRTSLLPEQRRKLSPSNDGVTSTDRGKTSGELEGRENGRKLGGSKTHSNNGSASDDDKLNANNVSTSLHPDKVEEQSTGITTMKGEKGRQKEGEIDPDDKWRSNYVPTPYDLGKMKGEKGRQKEGEIDPDDKWRSNYVHTPYDLGKVEFQDGPHIPHLVHKDRNVSRPLWANKMEFVLACFGLSAGLGNVVRFPYLAYRYGGGAFLLPYLLLLVLVGMPLYFLEMGLGQYAQLGPLNVWKCVAAMQGIGVATVVLSLLTAVYYNQIMAYCLYYIFASLAYIGHPLPWTTCGHRWSTSHCYTLSQRSLFFSNVTAAQGRPAALEYFRNRVLHQPVLSTLSDSLGLIRWDLCLCLFLSWVLVMLLLVRSVRSTGRAAYATTFVPCILLFVLMISALLLDGADRGLVALFAPRWTELADATVWRLALEQVLFSLSVAYGAVIMFGSYNPFSYRAEMSAVCLCIADFVVSVCACVLVFSILGSARLVPSAGDWGDDMGLSLMFVTLASAMGSLSLSHVWTVFFFIMLFLFGLGSLAGLVHVLLGGVLDTVQRLRDNSATVALLCCCCGFLLGLPLCAEDRGHFLLTALSTHGIGAAAMVVAAAELLTVAWLYGARRIADDFALMSTGPPSMFWRLCWALVAPAIVLALLIQGFVVGLSPDSTPDQEPSWEAGVRWGLFAASLTFIPLVFLIVLLTRASTKQLGSLLSPALSWAPGDPEGRRKLLMARQLHDDNGMGRENLGYFTRDG